MTSVKVFISHNPSATEMLLIIAVIILLRLTIADEALVTDEYQLLQELMNETSCLHQDCWDCSCEPNCLEYGDCCHHTLLEYLRNSTDSREPILQSPDRWECVRVRSEMHTAWLYMVSYCPAEWKDVYVALLCMKLLHPSTKYMHILDVPVFNTDTGFLYANIYCAECNNDSASLAPTKMKFFCDPPTPYCPLLMPTAVYQPGTLTWLSGNFTIITEINNLPYIRLCEDYVNKCYSQNSNLETIEEKSYRKLCQMYEDTVYIPPEYYPGSKGLYKNIYCALCNGIHIDKSKCYDAYKTPEIPGIPDHPIVHLADPSFAVITDIIGDGKVGEISKCGVGQKYDTVQETCIDYFCGENYEMDESGDCIRKTNITTAGGLMDSCAKILLLQSEYLYINDSIIRVNRTNDEISFETESFEKVDNGSVLICAPDTVTSNISKFSSTQGLVSSICLVISLVCLAVHILVYASLPKLHNLPGMNLLSLSCSIFVAQFFFLSGAEIEGPHVLCVIIGAITHLSYLASFFWMNVMAFDMCRTFASNSLQRNMPGQKQHTFAIYSLYAWMCPCLLVSTALILDATDAIPQLSPRYAEPNCWINSRTSLVIFLALPLFILLVGNIIFFTKTACAIKRVTADAAIAVKGSTASERDRYFLYLKLASIVGLTWIFGFIAPLANHEVLWYTFIILNSLQVQFAHKHFNIYCYTVYVCSTAYLTSLLFFVKGAFIFFAFSFKRKILSMVLDLINKKTKLGGTRKRVEQESTNTNISMISKTNR